VYRWLLCAYPHDFRQKYGPAMLQVFHDLCRRGGKFGLARVWERALIDYVLSLVSEHMNRGAIMTRMRWIQLSGWGMAASGFFFFAGLAAGSRPEYNPGNMLAWPLDPFLNSVDLFLVAAGLLLMSAGMGGFWYRFQQQVKVLGRSGLVIGVISGLVGAAGALGLGYSDSSPWWNLFMLGIVGVNLGLILFGITCWREHLFEHWNGLPLLIGATTLIAILASIGLVQWPGPVATVLMITFMAVSMGLLGYRLQSEATEQQATAI
jgi:hypothetical protein